MPTAPYAKVLVSVDGAANTSGGIDVAAGAVVTFSAESTVGWRQQLWEIYDYPEGWTTPAGWTKADDGTIYSTAVTPASITMPTDLWGPWGMRLTVNDGIDVDPTIAAGLVDETTALMVLSPKGQRALMALEGGQFCTPTTLRKQWVRTSQRNAKALEDAFDGIDTVAGDAGGVATVTAGSVENTADAKYKPKSSVGHASTISTTTNHVTLFTPEEGKVYGVNVVVVARDAAGTGTVLGMWGLRAVAYVDGDGSVQVTPDPASDASPVLSAGAAGMSAKLSTFGGDVTVDVKGLADTNVTWGWELYAGKLDA